jgi:hypothetical protein
MTPEQIEIERKKFDIWHKENHGFSASQVTCLGVYIHKKVQIKWMTWLACCESRDSLCVTLPKFEIIYDDYAQSSGNYYRKEEIDYLLQSAGINYRVEE